MQPEPRTGLSASLTRATEGPGSLLAVVDVDAFDRNAATLVRRAHGLPVRVATKSLKSRQLIERALAHPGRRGLMWPGADRLALGDRVWFRHAKAGELAEPLNEVVLVSAGSVVGAAETCQGEGRHFG